MSTIPESLFVTVFGMSVVFLALVSLIVMIAIQGRFVKAVDANQLKKVAAAKAAAAPVAVAPVAAAPAPVETVKAAPAAVYSGPPELRLINVDDKTAAIIMAIICDEMKLPVNELYFKSIKALN